MRHEHAPTNLRRLACQRLEPRRVLDASALRITEFVASNDNSLSDFEGDSPDWIELHNPSEEAVDLAGLYLTDKADNLTKWEFPTGSEIAAGGYLVVFASNKDTVMLNGELHTNFALSADGEYLGLTGADGTSVIDAFTPGYPPQSEDVSYGLEMAPTGLTTTLVSAGDTARAWRPTSSLYDTRWTSPAFNDAVFNLEGPTGFGYEASPGGTYDYTSLIETSVPFGATSLYVRMPFDATTLSGADRLTLRMQYDDGFVAYLNGVEIAQANAPDSTHWDSRATANHDDFDAVEFQTFDVSAAISALVEGTNVLAIHALNVSDTSSDFLLVPELVAEQSLIVAPESLGFFDTPTPGYGNGENFAGFAAEPTFSVPHGFYEASQQVAITSATAGATIVYTTDGSTPSVDTNLNPVNGTLYTAPIPVSGTMTIRAISFKQDFRSSFVQSSSYLFLDDIVTQSSSGRPPTGWPTSGVNGQELNYGMDAEILAQYGEQAIKDALTSIPSIALTTDLENLFDPSTGIYVNAGNRGRTWERESSVELINPDGAEGFTTNAGLRIRGGYSRGDFNPKHAFRLYFRGDYGDGKLNYSIYGEGVEEFDVLDLRTAQNYSWSSEGNTQNTFLREVFARDTQADLGQPHTRSQYYHLYLDGQYWGLYMTQERVEEFFGESYFGGDETDYDVVKSDLAVSGGTEIADGNDAAWRQLYDLAQAMADNPSGAADNYWTMQGLDVNGIRDESLEVLLDVDNLVDYMLIIFYTGGYDTGISRFLGNDRANNWFGIRNRVTGDQGFQFFMHDNEHSLGAEGNPHGTLTIDRTGPFYSSNDSRFEQFNPHFLHQDLLEHPEYRQRFVDRVQEVMFNDGPLTADASIARLLERKGQIDSAILAEAARWGDSKTSTPRNKATWQAEVNWLTNTYFPQRGTLVLAQLRGDDLFTSFVAPVFSQHGGEVPLGYELSIASRGGTIYYTTDGESDPRLIGGGVNPSAAVEEYNGPLPLTSETTVRARLLTSEGDWSGLVEATFTVPSLPGDYDANGLVEQADYDVWRDTYGSTADLRADGNGNGRIEAADYTVWRNAFSLASSSAASVSEPALASSSASEEGTSAEEATRSAFAQFQAARAPFTPRLRPTPSGMAMRVADGTPEARLAALALLVETSPTDSQPALASDELVPDRDPSDTAPPEATRLGWDDTGLAAF